MLRIALPVALLTLVSPAITAAGLDTDAQKAAYAIGYQFGANAKRDGSATHSGAAGHDPTLWLVQCGRGAL